MRFLGSILSFNPTQERFSTWLVDFDCDLASVQLLDQYRSSENFDARILQAIRPFLQLPPDEVCITLAWRSTST